MPPNLANKRILIVDDEESILEITRHLLEPLGASIQTTTSPLVALEVIGRAEFDVVITDLSMPEMTGLELAQRVRSRLPRCKLVLLTGAPTAGVSDVFDAVIRKPFTGETFKQRIASLL